jgi:hypothetical protein
MIPHIVYILDPDIFFVTFGCNFFTILSPELKAVSAAGPLKEK